LYVRRRCCVLNFLPAKEREPALKLYTGKIQRKFADEHYVKLRIFNFVRLIIFMNTDDEVALYFISA
jgi:hypothetical protein